MTAFEVLEKALAAAQDDSTRAIEQSVATRSAVSFASHRRGAAAGAQGDTSNVDDILEQLLHAARPSSSPAETDETKAATGLSATPEALAIAEALAAVEASVTTTESPASVPSPPSAATVPATTVSVAMPPVVAPTTEASAVVAPPPPTTSAPAVVAPTALADKPTAASETKPTKPSVEWGPREMQEDAVPASLGSPSIETVRRRHIWPIFICAAAVFIIASGLLTYFNRSLLAEQTEHHTAIQRQGNAYLDESIALIQEADSVIVALDRATESQIAEEDIPRLEALLDKTDSVQSSLDDAINKALQAKETFLEDESQQLAQYAQDAAAYRKQMLEMSGEIVRYDIAAMRSALALEYAWTLIIDADANMRSAVETVAEGGAGAVTESRDYNQEAVNKLVLADEALDKAVEAFSTVDVGALRAYLEAKKASAEIALASDEAFLEGSYYTAYLRNEEFIEKDAEAVMLAAAIPGDLLSLVVTAYEQAIGPLHGEYAAIRSQATDVDVYLRAYLGVDVLQEVEAEQNPESTE
jgi:hypothetical protein